MVSLRNVQQHDLHWRLPSLSFVKRSLPSGDEACAIQIWEDLPRLAASSSLQHLLIPAFQYSLHQLHLQWNMTEGGGLTVSINSKSVCNQG